MTMTHHPGWSQGNAGRLAVRLLDAGDLQGAADVLSAAGLTALAHTIFRSVSDSQATLQEAARLVKSHCDC